MDDVSSQIFQLKDGWNASSKKRLSQNLILSTKRKKDILVLSNIQRVTKERNPAKPQICWVEGLRGNREPA